MPLKQYTLSHSLAPFLTAVTNTYQKQLMGNWFVQLTMQGVQSFMQGGMGNGACGGSGLVMWSQSGSRGSLGRKQSRVCKSQVYPHGIVSVGLLSKSSTASPVVTNTYTPEPVGDFSNTRYKSKIENMK